MIPTGSNPTAAPPVTPQEAEAANAALTKYVGRQYDSLSGDEKQDLAKNLATVARFRDSSGVYTDSNSVLTQLNTIGDQRIDPTMYFNLFTGKPALKMPPPSDFGTVKEDDKGNLWFTPGALGVYLMENLDLLTALKQLTYTGKEQELQTLVAYQDAQESVQELTIASAKKEAEQHRWAMIGAIVGIGLGVAGGIAGGVKGGFTGAASAFETSTRMGQQAGSILTEGAKSILVAQKGEIDASKIGAETSARMLMSAQETWSQMSKDAASEADKVRESLDRNSQMLKKAFGIGRS